MYSSIEKQQHFTEILEKEPAIIDLYANMDFTMEKDGGEFLVLTKGKIDIVSLAYKIQELFEMPAKVYLVHNNLSAQLSGYKIIWRKGRWLL